MFPDNRARSLSRLALLAAFSLSGAASLVFELIWTRRLLISLGATATAVGVVLGAFMGGMAIGSALAGRPFLARRDPIAVYAVLEGAVGLYGFATLPSLRWLATLSPGLQLVLALGVLVPSTAAMGASLPVVSRAMGAGRPRPAVEVGRVYAANTAGAVAGPLLAVFWLFPSFGLTRSLHIAALADLTVCFGLLLGRRAFPLWRMPEMSPPPTKGSLPHPPTLLLIAMGVSGAGAMVYELAWSRTLSLVYGSSVYGVSIMLSTFLLGIAGGSALAAIVLRRRAEPASVTTPAWLLAGSAGGAFLSLLIARGLPFLFVNLYRSFPERDTATFFTEFVVSALLMLPATVCLGAMLPVATSASSQPHSEIGRQVSWLYTANLLGSTAGAVAAAGLLIGNIGLDSTVRTASVACFAAALVLALGSRGPRFSAAGVAIFAGGALFVAGIHPGGGPVAKGFGFYSDPRAYDRYDTPGLRQLVSAHQLLYYRDGPTATVAVQKVDRYLFLKINGKTDASNGPGDVDTQLLLAHLPLMAADAKRVAVIGWGTGMTAGAVLTHDVEQVVAFEIEPAVVEASHLFDAENGKSLEDPRLRLVLGDARSRLLSDETLYDLIISEPSNPWLTGVANLFTKEFFELVASRLQPGGLVSQWFHLYGMSAESTRSLLATFRSVFPHVLVFKDRDLILIGARRPIRFDIERMERLFDRRSLQRSLARTRVLYPFDLLASLRLDEQGVASFSGAAPLNTDDNLLLELAAPKSLYQDHLESIRSEMARYSPSLLDCVTGYRSPAQVYVELAASYFTRKRTEEALRMCRRALELETSFEGLKLLGLILKRLGRIDEARRALEEALPLARTESNRRFVQAALGALEEESSQ